MKIVSNFLIMVFVAGLWSGDAEASSSYTDCLSRSIEHADYLLPKRGLDSSTRFCIRQSRFAAINFLDQYTELIKPELQAHKSAVKACKKDKQCEGVEDAIIVFQTTYQRNCNRPRVKFNHSCRMPRVLKGYMK